MSDDYRLIPLSKGIFAKVSPEDYERVSAHKWHANQYKPGHYYARSWIKGEGGEWSHVLLHRFILNAEPGQNVDHIDLDRLNCTRANVRLATNAQNITNQKARSNTGYKGVHRTRRGKFLCSVGGNGKGPIHLGYFDDVITAAQTYDEAARSIYGEFARVNFPRDGELAAR